MLKVAFANFAILILAISSAAQVRMVEKSVFDGAGDFAKVALDLAEPLPSNAAKRKALEPFIISFFGWRLMPLTSYPIGTIEAGNITFSRIALDYYDNGLTPTLKAIEERSKKSGRFEAPVAAERSAIQKFVVQKHGGKYLGFEALLAGNFEEPDPRAKWWYDVGSSLGELGGNVTIWYRMTSIPAFDQTINSTLLALGKKIDAAPNGMPSEFIANLRKLKALGGKARYSYADKKGIGDQLRTTLISTMKFEPPPAGARKARTPNAKPDHKAEWKIGKTLAARGKYTEAVTAFTRAIYGDPTNGPYFFSRASAYVKLNDVENAISDFSAMVILQYRSADAFYNRGTLEYRRSNYSAAIRDLTRSIELAPRSKNVHYNRGLVHLATKEPDKAAADFSFVLDLDPKYGAAYVQRAKAYCQKKLIMSAIADQERAIGLGEKVEKGCALIAP